MTAPTDDDRTERLALPAHLVDRIEARLAGTDFDTPDAYVAFVLEETLARVESEEEQTDRDGANGAVQSRLESLGYLDR